MEWLYLKGINLEHRGANGETALQRLGIVERRNLGVLTRAVRLTSGLGHTRALQWLPGHLVFRTFRCCESQNFGTAVGCSENDQAIRFDEI